MKKVVFGFILGCFLTISATVYAEEMKSLVGRVIQGQFPVTVNGEKLSVPAIVIDGTSFLPVRAIGEALNMEVKFDADLGIELYDKADDPKLKKNDVESKMTEEDIEELKIAEEQISKSSKVIEEQREKINQLEQEKVELQEVIKTTTDSQRLMYLKAELSGKDDLIRSSNEIIESHQKVIQDYLQYIDKIKSKYSE